MKLQSILILALSLFSVNSIAGEWTRKDAQTITLKGHILNDEYTRFSAVFDSDVKKLIVDSGGGETGAGMKIGLDLRKFGVGIEVQNWCLSSCANYLFVGATERVIVKGIVGFHGNVKACTGGAKWAEVEADLQKQGIPQATIDELHVNLLAQEKVEAEFLKSVGVSQALFDRSCEPDKGMGDGVPYTFLLPTPETFKKYGLDNVVGIQDPETIKAFPGPLVQD